MFSTFLKFINLNIKCFGNINDNYKDLSIILEV